MMLKDVAFDTRLPRLLLIALLTAGLPTMGGCENESPLEETAEEIDDAAEDAADEAEDALDEVDDEI